MDMVALFFPQGNDIEVIARFPEISDGTGSMAEFFTKLDKTVPDGDPSTVVYQAEIEGDPDNPGATMSQFNIPSADTGVTGAFWWRVDAVDSLSNRRTAACGTLLVEAV